MPTKDTNPDKTSGHDPAAIELDDGTIIDAAHSFRNKRDTLLFLCIEEKGGSDVVVPLESDKPAYAKSELGEDVLDLDTDDDDDVESGDDDDGRVVADGGRDVPPCTCGADLVRTAELTTAEAPVVGARGPSPPMRPVPDAECTNCGRLVGAMYGGAAAISVWEARGESPPARDDDGDNGDSDDADGRLMTDGGEAPPIVKKRNDVRRMKDAGAMCALPSCDEEMDKHDLGLLFCSPACGSKHRERYSERGMLTEESTGVPVEEICEELSGGYIGN